MAWEDVHYGLLGSCVQDSGRLRVPGRHISEVRLRVGHQATYSRVTKGRKGRTAVSGVFKVSVGRKMDIMLRLCAKVDLHDSGQNNYNLHGDQANAQAPISASGPVSRIRRDRCASSRS